jgi:hypothetical protein
VSKSSAAAEIAAADTCLNDILWARDLLAFLGFPQMAPTPLYMDNQAAITMIRHGRTTRSNKYFRIRVDALHDAFQSKLIEPIYMKSCALPADALTKSLSGPMLQKHKVSVQAANCPIFA